MFSLRSLITHIQDSERTQPRVVAQRCIRLFHKRETCQRCQDVCPAACIYIGRPGTMVMIGEECIGCERCVSVCPTDTFIRAGGLEEQWLQELLEYTENGELCLQCSKNHGSRRGKKGIKIPCLGSLHSAAILYLVSKETRWVELLYGDCTQCRTHYGNHSPMLIVGAANQLLKQNNLPVFKVSAMRQSIICTPPFNNSPIERNGEGRRRFLRELVGVAKAMGYSSPKKGEPKAVLSPKQTKHALVFATLQDWCEKCKMEVPTNLITTLGRRKIDPNKCKGCGLCSKLCRMNGLQNSAQGCVPMYFQENCSDCGLCLTACRREAIS